MAGSGASKQTWEGLDALLPSLRRFTHALLSGRQRLAQADALVELAVDQLSARPGDSEPAVTRELYRGVLQAYRKAPAAPDAQGARRAPRGTAAAIARLPLDEREVLLLVVLGGFSYGDVATILAVPLASVVARLARGRAALAATGTEGQRKPVHLRLVK